MPPQNWNFLPDQPTPQQDWSFLPDQPKQSMNTMYGMPVIPKFGSGYAMPWLSDVGVTLAKGTIGAGKSLFGLTDLTTLPLHLSGWPSAGDLMYKGMGMEYATKNIDNFLNSMRTDEYQKAQKQLESGGLGNAAKTMWQNPALAALAVTEAYPYMRLGGYIGGGFRGLGMSPVKAAATGEGFVGAGAMANQLREETGRLTPLGALTSIGSGALTGAISRLTGGLSQKMGLPDPDVTMVDPTAGWNRKLGSLAGGAIMEGPVEEGLQSAQETAAYNLATGKPVTQNMGPAVMAGSVAGAGMGMAMPFIGGHPQPNIDVSQYQTQPYIPGLENQTPQQDDIAMLRRRAMSGMQSEFEAQMFELKQEEYRAQQAGDWPRVTELINQQSNLRGQYQQSTENWAPPAPITETPQIGEMQGPSQGEQPEFNFKVAREGGKFVPIRTEAPMTDAEKLAWHFNLAPPAAPVQSTQPIPTEPVPTQPIPAPTQPQPVQQNPNQPALENMSVVEVANERAQDEAFKQFMAANNYVVVNVGPTTTTFKRQTTDENGMPLDLQTQPGPQTQQSPTAQEKQGFWQRMMGGSDRGSVDPSGFFEGDWHKLSPANLYRRVIDLIAKGDSMTDAERKEASEIIRFTKEHPEIKAMVGAEVDRENKERQNERPNWRWNQGDPVPENPNDPKWDSFHEQNPNHTTPYRLPDGRVVQVKTEVARGQDSIDFTTQQGIVKAVRIGGSEEVDHRNYNPEEHGQPWWWKYGAGSLSNWPPTSFQAAMRNAFDEQLQEALDRLREDPDYNNPEIIEQTRIVEEELDKRQKNRPMPPRSNEPDWERLLPTHPDNLRGTTSRLRSAITNPYIPATEVNKALKESVEVIISTTDLAKAKIHVDYLNFITQHLTEEEKVPFQILLQTAESKYENLKNDPSSGPGWSQSDLDRAEDRWDVFNPADGIIIAIFDSEIEAIDYVANHPKLDYAPHNPNYLPNNQVKVQNEGGPFGYRANTGEPINNRGETVTELAAEYEKLRRERLSVREDSREYDDLTWKMGEVKKRWADLGRYPNKGQDEPFFPKEPPTWDRTPEEAMKQKVKSDKERLAELRQLYPNADSDDLHNMIMYEKWIKRAERQGDSKKVARLKARLEKRKDWAANLPPRATDDPSMSDDEFLNIVNRAIGGQPLIPDTPVPGERGELQSFRMPHDSRSYGNTENGKFLIETRMTGHPDLDAKIRRMQEISKAPILTVEMMEEIRTLGYDVSRDPRMPVGWQDKWRVTSSAQPDQFTGKFSNSPEVDRRIAQYDEMMSQPESTEPPYESITEKGKRYALQMEKLVNLGDLSLTKAEMYELLDMNQEFRDNNTLAGDIGYGGHMTENLDNDLKHILDALEGGMRETPANAVEMEIQEISSRNPPDIAFRDVLPESLRTPLVPPETWQSRALAFLERLRKEEGGFIDIGRIISVLGKRTGVGQGVLPGGRKRPKPVAVPGQPTPRETHWVREALNLPTNSTTMLDLSAPGRQGLSMILTPEFWKAVPRMFGALHYGTFKMIDNNLKSKMLMQDSWDPVTQKRIPSMGERLGIKIFAPASEPGPKAEATASKWLEVGLTDWDPLSKVWKHTAGYPIRATNRAFITFLNHLNVNRSEKLLFLARDMATRGLNTGRAPMSGLLGGIHLSGGRNLGFTKAVTPQQALDMNPFHNMQLGREIVEFTNAATGHASPTNTLEKAVAKIGPVLFSPGLLNSRIRMMNPATYVMATPFVRQQYLKALLSTAAAWFIMAHMIKNAVGEDATVSDDPTSADFGKIRVGDARLDLGGGFLQFAVAYARGYNGGSTSSASGEFHRFGEGYQAQTQEDMMERFFVNKLNPVTKLAYDIAAATEYNPVHMGDRLLQLAVPLIGQDLWEINKENPDLLPLFGAASMFGGGSQIYAKGESISKFIPEEDDWLVEGGGGLRSLMPWNYDEWEGQ